MSRAIFHTLGSGWTPLWLGSALVEWWDPEVGVTKDGGTDRVSQWTGKISSTPTLHETGSRQPLWLAAASEMNGRQSIYFDGVRALYANGTVPAAVRVWQQAHTIIGVCNGYGPPMGNGNGPSPAFLLLRYLTKVRAHVWGTGGSGIVDGVTTVGNTTRALVGQRASGPPGAGNLEPILNGVADAASIAIGGTAGSALNWMTLGARNSVPSGSAAFNGYLGDQFIFNRALTDAELIQLARWTSLRWGI